MVIMKLLPDSKIAYLTKKLNARVGIISKLLISPPRHGRYWAVKPIPPKKIPARETLPWVPEAFHARFPVSPLVSSRQRPKTCRPAADEAPRHTGEKTSGTQGRETCL